MIPGSLQDVPPECLLDKLPDACPLTQQVPLVAAKHCELMIAVGHRVFIKNTKDEPAVLKKGLVVAGFYKGRWISAKQAETDIIFDYLFDFHSADDNVFLKDSFTTMMDVIQSKRATAPADSHVGFHQLKDRPKDGKPQFFFLEKNQDVFFHFESIPVTTTEGDNKVKVSNQNCAGLIPEHAWKSWATELVWSVRWPPIAVKGLQPIRPWIVMACAVHVPPLKIIELKPSVKAEAKMEKQES